MKRICHRLYLNNLQKTTVLPSTNSDTPTGDLTDEATDIIPIVASESSNIIDKPAVDVDLQQTNTISDDDQLQLDLPRSHVSSNNEIADTFEAINEVNTVDMTSVSSPHSLIRKHATEKYLATASKRIKAFKEYVTDLSSSYSIGDYVGIKIDKVDRTKY